MKRKMVQYWLLKTEPGQWSWEDQKSNGGVSQWDGVKNRQAQNNLKSMREGDLCFFYHSGSGPNHRCIVGVVEVIKQWYTIGSEEGKTGKGEDGAVDVRSMGEMRKPVGLKDMKTEPALKGFGMLKQPRLSVVPVEEGMWEKICEMGGGYGGEGKEVEEEREEKGE